MQKPAYVAVVVAVVLLLFLTSLSYFKSVPLPPGEGRNPFQGKQVLLRTGIYPTTSINSTSYTWFVEVWNNGTTPIESINATLDTSSAIYADQDVLTPMQANYTMNSFIIEHSAPPPCSCVSTVPPVQYVTPDRPLDNGFLADNYMVVLKAPPYLATQSFPVTVFVAFINGTVSSFKILGFMPAS